MFRLFSFCVSLRRIRIQMKNVKKVNDDVRSSDHERHLWWKKTFSWRSKSKYDDCVVTRINKKNFSSDRFVLALWSIKWGTFWIVFVHVSGCDNSTCFFSFNFRFFFFSEEFSFENAVAWRNDFGDVKNFDHWRIWCRKKLSFTSFYWRSFRWRNGCDNRRRFQRFSNSFHFDNRRIFFFFVLSVKQMEVDGNRVKLAIWVKSKSFESIWTMNFVLGYSRTRTFSNIDARLWVRRFWKTKIFIEIFFILRLSVKRFSMKFKTSFRLWFCSVELKVRFSFTTFQIEIHFDN